MKFKIEKTSSFLYNYLHIKFLIMEVDFLELKDGIRLNRKKMKLNKAGLARLIKSPNCYGFN